MRIISGTVSGVSRLAGLQVELSRKARQRLKWFDYYNSRGNNARLTCRHFDISPQTFYRWKKRYNPKHLESLEDRSHRPRHLRQPTYSAELVEAVLPTCHRCAIIQTTSAPPLKSPICYGLLQKLDFSIGIGYTA
ncbi:helix-turn-helix domain-containing protein [Chloroflexota bacterium]